MHVPSRAARLALALALLLAAGATSVAARDEMTWRGPLRVRSQFPLDLVTLDLTPAQAFLFPRGGAAVDLLVVHSNTFEITPTHDARALAFEGGFVGPGFDFLADAEITRTTLTASFGLARRVQLDVEVPALTHGGGFMDSIIEDWHDIAGLENNDRDLRPQDGLDLDVIGGSRARLVDEGTSMGDVTLRLKWLLVDGVDGALTLETDAKAPTGDEESFAGSGEWDYGAALLFGTGRVHHAFHGGIGWQSLGQPETWPIEIEDRVSGFAGWEWRPNVRWSTLVQVMAASSILPAFEDRKNDDPRIELAAGFEYGRGSFALTSGFVQNLSTNDNTADLGLFFGLGWHRQ